MQTVIFGTTPTQKEALKAMSAELEKAHERRSSRTFMESAEEHIESKRNVLSPSTVAGYRNITSSLHHPSTKDDGQHTGDHHTNAHSGENTRAGPCVQREPIQHNAVLS